MAARTGAGEVRTIGPMFNTADYGFAFREGSSLPNRVDSTLLLLREDGIYDHQGARVAARSGQAMASPVVLASAGATRAEPAVSNAPTAMARGGGWPTTAREGNEVVDECARLGQNWSHALGYAACLVT